MKREIKKQLKEDEFVSLFTRIMDFFQAWRHEFLLGLAALLGVVVIAAGLLFLKGVQARSASDALGRILDLRSGLEKAPGDVAKLEELARKGKFARVAMDQLASYWIEKGDLAKAAAALSGLKESPKDFFYWQAKDLEAQIAILKGDIEGGLKILTAIEQAKPKDFNLDAVLFHKAEALEKKGDKAGALALFKALQTDFPQSYFGYDAGQRARRLEAVQ